VTSKDITSNRPSRNRSYRVRLVALTGLSLDAHKPILSSRHRSANHGSGTGIRTRPASLWCSLNAFFQTIAHAAQIFSFFEFLLPGLVDTVHVGCLRGSRCLRVFSMRFVSSSRDANDSRKKKPPESLGTRRFWLQPKYKLYPPPGPPGFVSTRSSSLWVLPLFGPAPCGPTTRPTKHPTIGLHHKSPILRYVRPSTPGLAGQPVPLVPGAPPKPARRLRRIACALLAFMDRPLFTSSLRCCAPIGFGVLLVYTRR
jgi:hypothetical protein